MSSSKSEARVDFVANQEVRCTFTAKHGKAIGWKPEFPAEHIVEAADAEVDLILQHLKS